MSRPKITAQTINRDALFQRPRAAAILTGLSEKFIYAGCKNGTIPVIRCGSDFLIDMTAWLNNLHDEAVKRR